MVRETAWQGLLGHDGAPGALADPISMILASDGAAASVASATAASSVRIPLWEKRIPALNTTARPGLRAVS